MRYTTIGAEARECKMTFVGLTLILVGVLMCHASERGKFAAPERDHAATLLLASGVLVATAGGTVVLFSLM